MASRSTIVSWAIAFVMLAGTIAIALHLGDLEEFGTLLVRLRPGWIVLAAAAQAGTYVCAAAVWHRILRRLGQPHTLRSLIPLGLAKLFADQAVPSGGFSGNLLVLQSLEARGVPSEAIAQVFMGGILTYYAAYLISALVSILMLWLHRATSLPVLATTVALGVIVGGLVLSVAWLRRGQTGRIRVMLLELPVVGGALGALARAPGVLLKDWRVLAEATVLHALVFFLDAVTLWLLLAALEVDAGFWIAYVSLVCASLSATVLPIPLGVGAFEAACAGMLSVLGVSLEAALVATFLLRGFTFWLPMLPGFWMTHRALAGNRTTGH